MTDFSSQSPFSSSEEASAELDFAAIEQAKEILQLMAHTHSAMKLFPDHHATVVNFQHELFKKLDKFIVERGALEVEVKENSFLVGGQTVFTDESITRSLPYLFSKDGLQTLTFLPELTQPELVVFLDTLKEIASLPPEVGDIVDALWQKDLTHIQYLAPDDYLISKMAGQNEHKITVDTARFSRGRVDLDSEDTSQVYRSLQALRYKNPKEDLEYQAVTNPMTEDEIHHIQGIMAEHRSGEAQYDFLDMTVELLHLEDRQESYAGLLAYFERLYESWIKNGSFGQAMGLIRRLEKFVEMLKPKNEERAGMAADLLAKFNADAPLDDIKDMILQGKIKIHAGVFEYLAWLGPRTLIIGSDILEAATEPEVKDMAFKFLETVGRDDPMLLTNLAQDKRPFTTRAAISVLGQANDRRFIPFLATFFTYKNRDIKLDAIRALGRMTDPLAHRTLLGFLRGDPESILRIEAARRIRLDMDPSLLQAVVNISADKSFINREPEERAAVLAAILRSGRQAGYAVNKRFLEKKSLFGRARVEALALSAVKALESVATPEAREMLRELAEKGRKRLRGAGREALERLARAAETKERTVA